MAEPLPRPAQARQPDPTGLRGHRRRSPRISEAIARELLDMIVRDGLESGSQLPTETEMAKMYDVGRGSLREAVRILEVYGLLTVRAGGTGGPTIEAVGSAQMARLMTFYLNAKDVTFGDLQDSARLLHAWLAGEAARRRDPEMLAAMRAAMARAGATDDPAEYAGAIREFHAAQFDVPGGKFLSMLYDAIVEVFILRVGRSVSLAEAQESLPAHEAILTAISSGNVEEAIRRAEAHVGHLDEQYERAIPGILSETVPWV